MMTTTSPGELGCVQQLSAPAICIQCGSVLQPNILKLRRARLEFLTEACAAFAEFTMLQNEFMLLETEPERRENLLRSQEQLDIVGRYLFDTYARSANGQ